MVSGQPFTLSHVIDEQGLDDAIGVELVVLNSNRDGDKIYTVVPMNVVKKEGNLYTFSVTTKIDLAGSFKVAYRMFPKNPNLPHRQDFCYVRWFE